MARPIATIYHKVTLDFPARISQRMLDKFKRGLCKER